MNTLEELAEKLWPRVDKTGDCWLWTGFRNAKGYGRFKLRKKTEYVHVVAFEIHHRRRLAKGRYSVGHTCENKHCVRKEHLVLLKGNGGGVNWTRKISPDQGREIRQRYLRGEANIPQLAREYGVANTTIRHHVTPVISAVKDREMRNAEAFHLVLEDLEAHREALRALLSDCLGVGDGKGPLAHKARRYKEELDL